MGSFTQNAMLVLKIAAVIFVINQIPPLRQIVNKQYFNGN